MKLLPRKIRKAMGTMFDTMLRCTTVQICHGRTYGLAAAADKSL